MHHRGLLQVSGEHDGPVLQPYFTADGKPLDFADPSWELIAYWIPTAQLTIDGLVRRSDVLRTTRLAGSVSAHETD